jgi:uncharacterized protein
VSESHPPESSLGPVAITGASGLIGTALIEALERDGIPVRRMVRSDADPSRGDILWDPQGQTDAEALNDVRAVVNLAGEPIGRRWIGQRKQRIRDSRVDGTSLLARSLAGLERPPKVLVSASAVGYYGDRGDEILTERSAPGVGFFPETAILWEAAAKEAELAGIRVAVLRQGVVLSGRGGALEKMLPAFKAGAGAQLGSGNQWLSWIAIGDLVRVIQLALTDPAAAGVINAVAPNPVRNAEFTRILGRVLRRPTLLRVPAAAMIALYGEMARHTLLASQRVIPERLTAMGFSFEHPDVEGALRAALDR